MKAVLLLTWAVLLTLWRRWFSPRRSPGLQAFHANYAADRLPAVSAEGREAMTGFGGCIACGLCDEGEQGRIEASHGEYQGVMSLMLGGSRSMPDYGAAARSFDHVPTAVLAQKELVCPGRVPMRQIAAFVRRQAAEALAAPGAQAGAGARAEGALSTPERS